MLLTVGSIYTKLGDFVKLLHFLTTVFPRIIAGGVYFYFRTKRGRLFEGGDYFKYFSQEVVPYIFSFIIPNNKGKSEIRCMSVKTSWSTPNLEILWIRSNGLYSLLLCGSIVAHPIIYRLVPSPFRFENRQYPTLPIPPLKTPLHPKYLFIFSSWYQFIFV